MSGSFYYGLKARFYGMIIQLPWSFFVTVIFLLPVIYVVDSPTQALLLQLIVYWTVFIALLWLIKDVRSQRILHSFKINGRYIHIFEKEHVVSTYSFDQIKTVRRINEDSAISRSTIGGSGVLLKFDDGRELPVLDQIINYSIFNFILLEQTGKS